jgi:putative SOS response-associated peptidase YedK
MCGRYTLIRPAEEVARAFDLAEWPDWQPRYNVAPTQQAFVVRQDGSARAGSLMRWGLVPPWSKGPGDGPPLINARADTAHEKPAFRSAFRKRRCLLIQDGFYEWKADGTKKLPHHFTLAGGGPFAVAALWERWEGGEVPLEAVALLTTEANDIVRPCHDRMPVILPPEAQRLWPSEADPDALRALLVPYPASRMAARAVGKAVGSPRNEGPQCLEPAGPAQLSLF